MTIRLFPKFYLLAKIALIKNFFKRNKFRKKLIRSGIIFLCVGTSPCLASDTTWIAPTSNNDIEDPSNWSLITSENQFSVAQNFTAGGALNFQVSNMGVDSSVGAGNDSVALVNTCQVSFLVGCSIGNDATLTVTNQGTYSGENSTNPNTVGFVGNEQLLFDSTLTVGSGLNLEVNNSGISNTAGSDNMIGTVDSQLYLSAAANLGNTCSISVNNEGINQGTGLSSFVGSIGNVQAIFSEILTSGSQSTFAVSNNGNNSGDINNNVANIAGSQLLF